MYYFALKRSRDNFLYLICSKWIRSSSCQRQKWRKIIKNYKRSNIILLMYKKFHWWLPFVSLLDFIQRFDRGRVLHHTVRMSLIMKLDTIGKTHSFLKFLSNFHNWFLIVVICCPYCNSVSSCTYIHDCTTNVVIVVEGLSDETQNLQRNS